MKQNPDLVLVEARFLRYNLDRKILYKLFTQGVGNGFYKRKVVDELGFFLPVLGGGDSEFSDRVRAYYGEKAVLQLNKFSYWSIERSDGLTSINPQGSNSRQEFIQYYKTWHEKKNGLKIDFPWRLGNSTIGVVKSMDLGQKNYIEKLQEIFIKAWPNASRVDLECSYDDQVFYNFSSEALGHYYNSFVEGREYITKLETKVAKLQDKKSSQKDVIESKKEIQNLKDELKQKEKYISVLESSNSTLDNNVKQKFQVVEKLLDENISHYNEVYESMPLWWRKIGALIRKTK